MVLKIFKNPNNHLENYWVFASSYMKPDGSRFLKYPEPAVL
jgi:hypothetical protein